MAVKKEVNKEELAGTATKRTFQYWSNANRVADRLLKGYSIVQVNGKKVENKSGQILLEKEI